MSDIPVYNETGTDLPPWILAHIKLEMIEYFGESVHAIRVQAGIQRHAYNAKTHEVRYAFFLSDFDFETPIHSGPLLHVNPVQPVSPVLNGEMSDEIELDDDLEFEDADDDAFVVILDDDAFDGLGSDDEELQALVKDRDSDDESEPTYD